MSWPGGYPMLSGGGGEGRGYPSVVPDSFPGEHLFGALPLPGQDLG